MSKTVANMQILADLGQSWDFLASSLETREVGGSQRAKLKGDIEALIYGRDDLLPIATAIGILEMIKHDLIVYSQG